MSNARVWNEKDHIVFESNKVKVFDQCYECVICYNHEDCRHGKTSRKGQIQICHCPVCQCGIQITTVNTKW